MEITLDRYSHALPTLQAEAMGRLDAVLGRSPLDAPDDGPTDATPTELWVDQGGRRPRRSRHPTAIRSR